MPEAIEYVSPPDSERAEAIVTLTAKHRLTDAGYALVDGRLVRAAVPVPTAPHEVEPRKSPCGHGRAPKDRRGSRNERLRGRILACLQGKHSCSGCGGVSR